MKVSHILRSKKLCLSCEIFPPKEHENLKKAEEVVRKLVEIKPDFISVTYGAGGGHQKNTVRLASIVQQYKIPALAHLTCVSSNKGTVAKTLNELKENGIENILALRGDPPRGQVASLSSEYHYASDLVHDIHQRNDDFCIGAACYPEGHPESIHRDDDILHLKEKVDCGCDFLTTQMFFDNNVFYNYLYRVLSKGIHIPVIAGIMPVTNAKQIKRISALSGAVLPARFLTMVDRFSGNSAAMRQAGIAYATEQIIDLISNGVHAIHIYTMNQPDIAARIFENLSEIRSA